MFKIGESIKIIHIVRESDIIKFSEVSGDNNPIHLDEKYAKKTIFKKRIAHGLLVASYISSAIGTKLPGEGTIYLEQSLKFRTPVYIDDEITTIIKIKDIPKNDRMVLETLCLNQNNDIVIIGEAIVIPPENII